MPERLKNQPGPAPTRKVAAGGAIGLLTVLILAVLGALGVDVPGIHPDELPVGEAFTGLAIILAGYLTRERE